MTLTEQRRFVTPEPDETLEALAARLDDPGYAIVRPPLVAIGPAHHDQIANAKSLCFAGVSSV